MTGDPPAERFFFPLLHGLGSVHQAFVGRNALFFVASVLFTWVIIAIGLDDAARAWQHRLNPFDETAARFWALTLSMSWIPIVALGLLRQGIARKDRTLVALACATGQAVILTVLLTTILKLATGRPQPESLAATAREFHLGAFTLQGGRFMWPSGHTSSSIAAAVTLATFRRWEGRTAVPAFTAALAVIAIMVFGCFHWVSDVVAGALIAWPIAATIGRRFQVSFAPIGSPA